MNDRLADRTAAYFFQFPLRNATISRNYLIGAKKAGEGEQEGAIDARLRSISQKVGDRRK
jgi:hypothetical protein